MNQIVRPLAFACVAAVVVVASACAFGWVYEKGDIDRRQIEAEERFEANIEKQKAEEAAKAASPQPGE